MLLLPLWKLGTPLHNNQRPWYPHKTRILKHTCCPSRDRLSRRSSYLRRTDTETKPSHRGQVFRSSCEKNPVFRTRKLGSVDQRGWKSVSFPENPRQFEALRIRSSRNLGVEVDQVCRAFLRCCSESCSECTGTL